MKALADYHHLDLFRSLQFLFEKRLGWELYRPVGDEWYPKYFTHPIEAEARSGLRQSAAETFSGPGRNFGQENRLFRWLQLEEAKGLDALICTCEANEGCFAALKRDFGLKCPLLRYTGNDEPVNLEAFDIFLPAVKPHFDAYVATGLKPGLHFHPEFDLEIYRFTTPPVLERPIIRTFLNMIYHHREEGSPWAVWQEYAGYAEALGARAIMHGVATPPAGVEVDLDIPLEHSFERLGRNDLRDRATWPDLRFNRGEPSTHRQVADLMQYSQAAIHPKTGDGYGFIIHQLAASGRPLIASPRYAIGNFTASALLERGETCYFPTDNRVLDQKNLASMLDPDNNAEMGRRIHRRFVDHVDFEDEAKKIKALL